MLDLRKIYEFHHVSIKNKYDSKSRLLFTGTDSLFMGTDSLMY